MKEDFCLRLLQKKTEILIEEINEEIGKLESVKKELFEELIEETRRLGLITQAITIKSILVDRGGKDFIERAQGVLEEIEKEIDLKGAIENIEKKLKDGGDE